MEATAAGRVLVIDDDPVVCRLVQVLLDRHGYRTEVRHDPGAGIECAAETGPDVILLDIEMPGLDGIEVCRLLRARAGLTKVPVMFFSARAKEQFIDQGFRAGAQDYLQKPFTEAELVARVANLTRLAHYEQSLRNTAEELRWKNSVLSHELEAARRVQWALLPTSLKPHPTLRSAVLYEPMVEIGGDLYDLTAGADGRIRLLVADVSGHGVVAALLAAFFKMGVQVCSDRENGPAAMLAAVNRELCRALDSADFVTAIAAWLDPDSGILRYASAGHVPGLILRASTGETERLAPTGGLIGILEESAYEECETRLAPGDELLLLTDGILESVNPEEEQYGIRRVEELLRRTRGVEPAEMLQRLRIEMEAFQRGTRSEDDLTALALSWNPPG